MPCLIQRSKPEDLSESCRNALPVEEVKTGIKDTFWKNGKRLLEEDEIAQLDENDADTYERYYFSSTTSYCTITPCLLPAVIHSMPQSGPQTKAAQKRFALTESNLTHQVDQEKEAEQQ